ncbi:hypothetical protein GTP23_20540 [Pseudoduganella sp. FT93W]|uniref:PIN domain-containing protein n=1 Tax=Duganella fentianensis TaxID=2692177 RepID=A0A845I4W8_9BURK|nr:hypothetical protein [Duganella fentianensis]MYN47437.1 hypothetical protein [Duganella fentianensis]
MKFNPSHAVVDADVARASGGSDHPISKSSREVLLGIKNCNIEVVFCPILLSEWKKHKSLFATQWLSSMVAKKKFRVIPSNAITTHEIEKAGLSEVDKGVALKDAHVVDIALSTGNFIASNDKTARSVFSNIANVSPLLQDLIWIVPSEDSEKLIAVFSEGGYTPKSWLIRAA